MAFLLALSLVSFQAVERLRNVQTIYIGSMGQSDEAERFKLLLEDALTKQKFTIVEKEQDADAVLSGVLSIRVYDKESIARVTVRLKNQTGALLWSGDFQPKMSFFGSSDTVKLRAENVAKGLRKSIKKAK